MNKKFFQVPSGISISSGHGLLDVVKNVFEIFKNGISFAFSLITASDSYEPFKRFVHGIKNVVDIIHYQRLNVENFINYRLGALPLIGIFFKFALKLFTLATFIPRFIFSTIFRLSMNLVSSLVSYRSRAAKVYANSY